MNFILKILNAFIVLVPLTLIGYGCFMIYQPLAFIVVGGLIWLDIGKKKGVEN